MTVVDSSFKAYMTKPGVKHKAKLITAHACNTGYTYNIILSLAAYIIEVYQYIHTCVAIVN